MLEGCLLTIPLVLKIIPVRYWRFALFGGCSQIALRVLKIIPVRYRWLVVFGVC